MYVQVVFRVMAQAGSIPVGLQCGGQFSQSGGVRKAWEWDATRA
jgi:hypothetical protein